MKRTSSFTITLLASMAVWLAACNQTPGAAGVANDGDATAEAIPAVTSTPDASAPDAIAAPAAGDPAVATAPTPAPTVAGPADTPPSREPDVVFVPTPHDVVDKMLDMAKVGPRDMLYDLGSGDGRIPIAAAKRWGTRGVGIDIDPKRIREANDAARAAGVTDKVEFIQGDLFEADLSKATVVTLYLLPTLNMKLRPRLLQLKPGTRIVSHNYHMDDWQPERTETVGSSTVYAWTVPETLPAHLR